MHDAAFAALGIAARMLPLAIEPAHLGAAIARLRAEPMLGASVTVPHKLAAAALCDDLTAEARAIGAVNCLSLARDRLVGHNTDAAGFLDGLMAAGCDPRGIHAVLLGSGGAALAVAYALREARAIEVIARRPGGLRLPWPHAIATTWTEDHLHDSFARADLLVDCTPAGLGPATDVAFTAGLPIAALRPAAWVGTLVYHRRTALLEAAVRHPTFDGRAMLVHQAAHAFELWTGRPAPLDVMARAL
jgi:shikimate dehydrogenase